MYLETSGTGWTAPASSLILGGRRGSLRPPAAHEAHVYFTSLDRPVDDAWSVLSEDELARAARFRFALHRVRFVAGRALLRRILGRYLACQPGDVRFEYGPNGKPSLAELSCCHGLNFNVSHSHDTAVVAFTSGRAVGIDIERCPAPDDGDAVARHFFSPAEVAALGAVSPAERADSFLRCWTRKEAYIKARGDGLSLALDSFDVSLAPSEPAALLAARHKSSDASRWSLVDLSEQRRGYVAALAVEGAHPTMTITNL